MSPGNEVHSGPGVEGTDLDHDYLLKLRQTHPSLRLLAADNLPLIVSFLYLHFIKPNRRAYSQPELVSQLEDYLYYLRQMHGEAIYPKTARQYLDDWSSGQGALLRKYYTDLGDEPELDLTPATEKAIEWLKSLEQRQFVGTESRLLTMFQLLREIVYQSEQDPTRRIAELERQKAAIEAEIERVRAGNLQPLDATQVKERYLQAEETGRRLLGDFRQVEYNFRALDRETRERIATSEAAKGKLLDTIFAEHDVIWDSDQGRSFRAFWEFLMSAARQEELQALLASVHELDAIRALGPEDFLKRIKFALLEAGEKVYKTNNLLVEQLRRYLDDQAYLENKRIMELVKSIEKHAVQLKDGTPDVRETAWLEEVRPTVELVMERGLYTVPRTPSISDVPLTEGEADIAVNALYQQMYVDEAELQANIRRALQTRSQISLAHLLAEYPVRRGLAELIGYFNIAHRSRKAVVAVEAQESVVIQGEDGWARLVRAPRVIFVR